MFLVTGGAGFIGSNIVAELAGRGDEVVVCDWLGSDERWRNLAKHEIADVISPPHLPEWLQKYSGKLDAVIHMGAVSSTTETNVDLIVENNIRTSLSLLDWCTQNQTRFIYASSAATYGDGSSGFRDEFSTHTLSQLRPLNAYGWSKHVVDRRIARRAEQGRPLPPQYVGLKFFNVYGPNEYHKGSMRSLIAQSVDRLRAGEPMRLFKSYRPDVADGAQLRDFIYVKDCVAAVCWLLSRESVNGLLNVGTGVARSWYELAQAMFAALGMDAMIEFVEMPAQLIEKYQYVTCADVSRLRQVGFQLPLHSLEDGIRDYVQSYLIAADRYR